MEKQPSGPYSGDTISFRGGGRRSGLGGGPRPGVMRRPRPRRSLGGGGGAAGSWASGKRRQSTKGQKSFYSRGRWGRGGTHMHTRTGTQACTGTRTHIGTRSQAWAHASHTHTHRVMGTCRAAARGASTQRPKAQGGQVTARGLRHGQERTGRGPANRPKGG